MAADKLLKSAVADLKNRLSLQKQKCAGCTSVVCNLEMPVCRTNPGGEPV